MHTSLLPLCLVWQSLIAHFTHVQVFDTAELGPLHSIQQHHRQLQAIAQSHASSHSGTFSHPSSPAPGNAVPVAYTGRSDSFSSSAPPSQAGGAAVGPSASASSAPSAAPSPFVTKGGSAPFHGTVPSSNSSSSLVDKLANAARQQQQQQQQVEIHGLPVGNVPINKPPSSIASSEGVQPSTAPPSVVNPAGSGGAAAGDHGSSTGKRAAAEKPEAEDAQSAQKKRRVGLTNHAPTEPRQ